MSNGIIFTVFLHFVLYSEDMFVKGTYDLDQDGMSEILLFTENNLRFVEMDAEGQHRSLWGITPENYFVKDAFIYDLQNDGIYELIVLADYFPGFRADSIDWLKLFSWSESKFEPVKLKIKNRKLMHPNIGDFEPGSGIFSVAVGSPSRTVALVQFADSSVVNTINIELPKSIHNGIGHIFVSFMNIGGDSHLAVFSNENELLNTVLFNVEDETVIIAEKSFPLNSAMNLLGSAIAKTDLDGDQSEELQLPFTNGDVLTLAFIDSVLTLTQSKFSGKELFIVPDTATPETINNVLLSRVESGLINPRVADEVEMETIGIVPNDSLKLGDTLYYRATADTGTGFYSFHWLAQPPPGAFFDPTTGYITWIPTRGQIGIHEFQYVAEKRLKDELVSETDNFGDRHRMVPIIEENEQSYSVIVVDTTKPPVIYVPPPVEPYRVIVHTPGKEEGKERFIFDGVPPFHVMVDEFTIPKFPHVSHSISANLGGITNNKSVNFSYSSNKDSLANFITLTIDHDLEKNIINARVEPSLDTMTITLNPADWQSELSVYPTYHFTGFPESMRLGESENGISLYENERDRTTKKYSYISIRTPRGEDRHNITIEMSAIELWNIKGEVTADSSEGKKISTTIVFSGEFNPFSIRAEMVSDAVFTKRIKEMKFKALEYMGVDSVVVDSAGAEMR